MGVKMWKKGEILSVDLYLTPDFGPRTPKIQHFENGSILNKRAKYGDYNIQIDKIMASNLSIVVFLSSASIAEKPDVHLGGRNHAIFPLHTPQKCCFSLTFPCNYVLLYFHAPRVHISTN